MRRPFTSLVKIASIFFVTAQALTAQAAIELWVSNLGDETVKAYNPTNGAFVGTVASGGGLTNPQGMALGADGLLYVASSTNEVKRFNPSTGTFVDNFVTVSGGGLNVPIGIAFGPNGNLYVSDYGNNTVKQFDGTGTLASSVASSQPEGLAFGPDGKLYVSVSGGTAIRQYDPIAMTSLGNFTAPGSGDPQVGGNLLFGFDLTFGPDGNLYVTEFSPAGLLRYDGSTGAFMAGPYAAGNDATGGFANFSNAPNPANLTGGSGLAFGPDGNLYVASFFQNRIAKFDGTTGVYIGDFPASGLSNPWSVMFAPEPSSMVLMSLGGLLIGRRCRNTRA